VNFEQIGDVRFQERTWRWQRIGWVASTLVALGGVIGAFGAGPLANRAIDVGAYRVRYENPLRCQAAAALHVTTTDHPGDPLTIRLFSLRPEDLVFSPEPDSTISTPAGVTPRFHGTVSRFEVDFTPAQPGILRIGLSAGTARQELSLVVLP
jgi:hypothetical protein